MSHKLFVSIPVDFQADSVVSWMPADVPRLAQGGLAELAAAATGYDVVVVVPGEEILQTVVKVPGKNRQRVLQALPFALEEQLIDDIDELHIALGAQLEVGSYQVAVMHRARLQQILDVFELAGVYPVQLVADYMLLPAQQESVQLLIDKQRFMLRHQQTAFAAHRSNLAALVNAAVPQDVPLRALNCAGESEDIQAALPEYQIQTDSIVSPVLAWLVQNADLSQGVNLLQGEYQRSKKNKLLWRPWYPVAALFLVWLVVEASMGIVNYVRLSRQQAYLQNQIETIYRGLYPNFPKQRKVIDARSRIETELKKLRSKGAQGGSGFNEMFSASATILHKTPGLIIKSLRYNDGRIDLEVQLAKLQDLDELKAGLQQQAGWQVEIQNASSEKDFVTARLQIKGAGV